MEKLFWQPRTSFTQVAMRKLLIIVICTPFFLGALQWILSRGNFYSTTVSIVLFSLLTVMTLVFLTSFVAKDLAQSEERLRYQEKLSRLLVENRRDYAIFMIDPKGIVMTWNKGAERLTGYSSEEIIGKSLDCLLTKEDRENNVLHDLLYNSQYQQQIEYEGWRVTKSGERFWSTITSTGVFDEHHNLIGFTKLYRNSTRQKETDEKLKRLVMSLERSNKELERFAYVASHDLQEPLRMIASYTQLLEKKYHDKLDQEANDYINFAVDGAKRMQQLITDLLAYSRVATHGKSFSLSNVNNVVKEAMHHLSIAIEETKAVITHDQLPTIVVDETQLLQLFQNLLSNAIKFHDVDSPRVHISVEETSAAWVFCVEDNGIGIAKEFQDNIFQIFRRLHSPKNYPGTGMGLAICKKIIERHGGKIWVENATKKGAKFCFTIPR